MIVQRSAFPNWRLYLVGSLIGLAGVTALAAWTRLWVLTALPIGFLFGFFLQKGDLCGSSAFSEVILMRDTRKLAGLWILIVVGMLAIAVLDLAGLVKLSPKPLTYLSFIVGGLVFGIGMVLAGGCISGCLYKGAAGNLNSIIALLGVPVGVMMVEYGPLHGLHQAMKKYVVTLDDGKAVSLYGLTDLPYWLLALLFAVATGLAVVLIRKRRAGAKPRPTHEPTAWLERAMTRSWQPWVAGVAIGLLMAPAYLSSAASGRNYPLGVTHGVMQAELLLIERDLAHVYTAKPATPSDTPVAPAPARKQVVWWLFGGVVSLMLGSWVSARLSGQAKLLPKPPDEILVALLGGGLIGLGAAFAGGCVVGNIMSGWALMSIGTVLFGIVVLLANWATTYIYLMGGQSRS